MTEEQWEPTRWWRVQSTDGRMWCETSDEQEARDSMFKEYAYGPKEGEPHYDKPISGLVLGRVYSTVPKYEWREET